MTKLSQPPISQQLPLQRWQVHPGGARVQHLAEAIGCSVLLAQILMNRDLVTPEAVEAYLEPESQVLPAPQQEFQDLSRSVDLLLQAIATQQKIVICGDYDADGMTSTALLLRALWVLGAAVDYAIPSRMQEGYGLNQRMVEEFHQAGVSIILTVDNGIAAHQPIARARTLGLSVIVTDHHDLPPELPAANAILNPKLLAESSPYRCLAGVGVAYILAVSLAQALGKTDKLVTSLLELFTLGTIADLAPLTGVNRRWLRRGLKLLPQSQFAGVQALIQVSGSQTQQSGQALKPEAIGFRLGPRINAVGRIADPQIVIELLTTDDAGIALTRAMQCEQANQLRQQLCEQIEQAAIAWCEPLRQQLYEQRVLVIVQPDWHHGVIGIVASRLVERYGVPVFIGTYEDQQQTQIRGSARGIPDFNVFEALQFCCDLLEKFGGHPAAGGFSLEAEHLPELRSRLSQFAHSCLQPDQLQPLLQIDAEVNFTQLTWDLWQELDSLQPCGIGNPEPIFATHQVQVLEQRRLGKNNAHLKVTLAQPQPAGPAVILKGMFWRWSYGPWPNWVDVAYRLRVNSWQGENTLELELLGVRPAEPPSAPRTPASTKPAVKGATPKLPEQSLNLCCPEPPVVTADQLPQWFTLDSLEHLVTQISGSSLLYGSQRPYLSQRDWPDGIIYDRPTGRHANLLLWTLPPSWTHLRWLLARCHPTQIYVRNQVPQLPTAEALQTQLQLAIAKLMGEPLNLLQLGQQWWVAPCTLVAALRELGYVCPEFPATCTLEQELKRLERWYLYPAHLLSSLG